MRKHINHFSKYKKRCNIPFYNFLCLKCDKKYEELASYDEKGVYSKVKCPACGSKRKEKQLSVCNISFTNPVGTSKFDNFEYQHGYKMEKAKGERRAAEAASHMGTDVYNNIDDLNSKVDHFGKVK